MKRPDRAWCRALGHLPRRIEPHPTDPCLTRETCLRCRVVLDRDRVTGAEREVPR